VAKSGSPFLQFRLEKCRGVVLIAFSNANLSSCDQPGKTFPVVVGKYTLNRPGEPRGDAGTAGTTLLGLGLGSGATSTDPFDFRFDGFMFLLGTSSLWHEQQVFKSDNIFELAIDDGFVEEISLLLFVDDEFPMPDWTKAIG
jgi:hypothetical protein